MQSIHGWKKCFFRLRTWRDKAPLHQFVMSAAQVPELFHFRPRSRRLSRQMPLKIPSAPIFCQYRVVIPLPRNLHRIPIYLARPLPSLAHMIRMHRRRNNFFRERDGIRTMTHSTYPCRSLGLDNDLHLRSRFPMSPTCHGTNRSLRRNRSILFLCQIPSTCPIGKSDFRFTLMYFFQQCLKELCFLEILLGIPLCHRIHGIPPYCRLPAFTVKKCVVK